MRIPSYIQCNRYGIFYFRRGVPISLRGIVGKREIICSLRTREPHSAVNSARIIAIQIDQLFNEARMGNKKNITIDYSFSSIELPDGTIETKVDMSEAEFDKLLESNLPNEEKFKLLNPNSNSNTSCSKPNNNVKDTYSLSELVDLYVAHWEAEHDGQKIAGVSMTKLRRLKEILGPDTPADSITHESAEHVRSTLSKIPASSTIYRGMTVLQVITATQHQDIDRLGTKTRNDHLELYSRVFSFAVKRTKTTRVIFDPFDGVRVKQSAKERKNKKRKAFNRDQIKTIFSTPLHTKPDTSMPYRYWTPLLALFCGARRGEMSALYLEDIQEVDGVWIIDFNENTPDKREKTTNGYRRTPIHPALIDYGFLSYVDQLRKSGETRLFPDLKHHTEKELYGRAIGEWMNGSGKKRPGFLEKLGIKGKKGEYVFHSFRHVTNTELRRSGVDGLMREQICGRSATGKTTGDLYYTEYDLLPTLYQAVARLDFSTELEAVKPWI